VFRICPLINRLLLAQPTPTAASPPGSLHLVAFVVRIAVRRAGAIASEADHAWLAGEGAIDLTYGPTVSASRSSSAPASTAAGGP